MTTTQVSLTDSEAQAIASLSRSQGKTFDEIVREALVQFLARNEAEFRVEAMRPACGLWRDRHDLPDPAQLRKEWDRF